MSKAKRGVTVPRPPAPPLGWVVLGYAAGVAMATLAFAAFTAAQHVFAFGLGTSSGGAYPIWGDVLFCLAFAIMTAVAAALPCLAAECLARLLGIRPAWWFAFWGAAAGLALGPLTTALPDVTGRYADALRTSWAVFVFSGAMGGFAYWWTSRRMTRRTA